MRAAIVQFQPQLKTNKKDRKPVKSIDGPKYYSPEQIKALRKHVRRQYELKNTWTSEKQWLLIDLATKTGLRLFEITNLRVGDLHLGYGEASLYVRDGKCSLAGTVVIDEALKRHLKQFMKHKAKRGEPTREDDFLFCSQRQECWSRQAVQHIVKRTMREAGIYRKGASVHALRHSYAFQLYAVENNIRAVQKQLRHSSIRSIALRKTDPPFFK